MTKKVVFIILMMLLIFTFFSINTNVQAKNISGIISGAENFISDGKNKSNEAIDQKELKNVSDLIYNTLLIIGTCAAVIIGAILGVQFIIGSVEQKVKVKESLIPFIAGCAVLFGAFGIWKLIITLLK